MPTDSDDWHRKAYEPVRATYNLPAWDDLTDEQRANTRKANESQRDYMRKLGDAIARGDTSSKTLARIYKETDE
jgi:hypothetical protein